MSHCVPSRLQIEVLSPLQPVAERFKEQYRTLATALDTTQHELPVQAIHTQGSGQELLGRNNFAMCHCHPVMSPKVHSCHILGAFTHVLPSVVGHEQLSQEFQPQAAALTAEGGRGET